MSNKYINDNRPTFPMWELGGNGRPKTVEFDMTLRDAMAMSVRIPDDYSVKGGEALIGEKQPPSDAEPMLHIDWWMRVEAAYRYRMADAMLKARENRND